MYLKSDRRSIVRRQCGAPRFAGRRINRKCEVRRDVVRTLAMRLPFQYARALRALPEGMDNNLYLSFDQPRKDGAPLLRLIASACLSSAYMVAPPPLMSSSWMTSLYASA